MGKLRSQQPIDPGAEERAKPGRDHDGDAVADVSIGVPGARVGVFGDSAEGAPEKTSFGFGRFPGKQTVAQVLWRCASRARVPLMSFGPYRRQKAIILADWRAPDHGIFGNSPLSTSTGGWRNFVACSYA
jgi:hypothetical protein